jgi:hypothetical protein
MKPSLVLLYTRDQTFDQVLARALFGTGTIILIARSVGDALQIVRRRGRELDFAVLDFNDGCRRYGIAQRPGYVLRQITCSGRYVKRLGARECSCLRKRRSRLSHQTAVSRVAGQRHCWFTSDRTPELAVA